MTYLDALRGSLEALCANPTRSLLTVLGVTQRLDDAAPRDKVTKKFYGEFEKQRKAFAAFIEGIPADSEDQRWYTAVVIDRLMFLWFLQEKGFLDNQRKYLQQRLQAHLDGDNAQSFYKRFLSPLFFQGFAQERTPETAAAIQAAFGSVPYLNGGLFAQHELDNALYYMRRGAWVSAIGRANYLLETYPQSAFQYDAVAVLADAYTHLGNKTLADDARRVLQLNQPDHPWLEGNWPKYPWMIRKLNPFAGEKSASTGQRSARLEKK